ncbi:ECF RNA polymerase sigma factor SigE [Lachnospiraceae bacterium]|nr:ECF RNA polymerase sigma factor SigE [Lachnospiraceae bacterium]
MDVELTTKADFKVIYEENFERVYKTAVKYSGNHHSAEEIVQNVFLKLYLNIDNVEREAAMAWLLLTTKYMALSLKRDRKREFLVEEMEGEAEVTLSESVENPEEFLVKKMKQQQFMEFRKGIFDALYKKNPRWYEAITITYILEKPQKEVAEYMDVTLDVLHSILYRAKQWIRENYAEEYAHLNKA